ncbi:MAG: putative DNA binding domain-containing protein [bacterium]|nr:putative DNA binding domain-containing protein [bacterium]
MKTSIEEFNEWLSREEGDNLEFKPSLSFKYHDYCAALANEEGGKILVGVNNNKKVIGTRDALNTHNKIAHEIWTHIRLRVDVEELRHPSGRVLVFHVPKHQVGVPIRSGGKYLMRLGESLTDMDSQTLKKILNEADEDFSAKIVRNLTMGDIDKDTLKKFQGLWAEKSQRKDYLKLSSDQILRHIGLLTDDGLNYASLILFGSKEKIDELLPGFEIIFEWRQDAQRIVHDFRVSWREPFLKIYDVIWATVNARNLRIPFQEGFVQREIFAFSEKPIREAVLNGVAHRDYTITGQSILITASPEDFSIQSPGGFPKDITIENIFYKHHWRNRCIAETLEKAGLVERSGQGMNDIFSATIKEGKGSPDLSLSDAFAVRLKIPAQVQDQGFVLFLEKVAHEKQVSFSFDEIYTLEKIRKTQITQNDFVSKRKFLDLGIIEKVGKTRGSKYILSHRYYAHENRTGIYTRLAGISREKQKELICQHLKKNIIGKREDFQDIFPELKLMDISNLLQELKHEQKIAHSGSSKKGYWKLCN